MIARILGWAERRHARKTSAYVHTPPPEMSPERQRLLADHFRLLEDNEPERARLRLQEFLRTS